MPANLSLVTVAAGGLPFESLPSVNPVGWVSAMA